MLLSLMALAACGRPDGNAVPLNQIQVGDVERKTAIRRDYTLHASGDSIGLSAWYPKDAPKAIVLAVHGYGDYGTSTFGAAATEWAGKSILTYAYDQRGFGRNPSNGNWPGHDALVQDLSHVARLVRARHPDLPLTVIGHSMGGAVVTAGLGEERVQADRAVLLAPALWGGDNLNPLLRGMAYTAHFFSPDKRWTGDGIVRIQASDNIELLRRLGRDPLYVRNPSSREFVGLIRLMDRSVAASDRMRTPVLVIYGGQDEVVPEEPIRDAFAKFSGPKRYERIETGWHMLLRDLEGQIVRDLVADFVLGDEPKS